MYSYLARATHAWSAVRGLLLSSSALFLAIVVVGQLMIFGELADFIEIHFPASSRIQSFIRIPHPGPRTIDDLLAGLVLLAVGGLGFALILRSSRFYDPFSKDAVGTLRLVTRVPPWLLGLTAAPAGLFIYLLLRLGDGDYHWTFPLWLGLVLAFVGTFCFWQDRKAGVKLSVSLNWWEGLGLAAVILMAYLVLTYRLLEIPDGIIGDEGALFETANAIAKHDFTPNIFQPGVYSWGTLMGNVFQAFFLKVFGASIWSWRFSAVVPELATIIPLYLLAREAFDRRIAFMSVFLFVFSPATLAFSRFGWTVSQTLFPVTASLLSLYLGLERGSKLYLFLAGVMAGLSFYTYPAAKVATPIVLGYCLYLLLSRQLRISHAISSFAVFAIGLVLLIAPAIIATNAISPVANYHKLTETFFLNDYVHRALFPDVAVDHVVRAGDQDMVLDPDYTARLLARGLVLTLQAFHGEGRSLEEYIPSTLSGPVASVFFVVGLWACIVGVRRKAFALVLIWLLLGAFGLAMLTSSPGIAAWLIPITPALPIMVAIGLSALAHQIRQRLDLFPAAGPLIIAAAMVAIAAVNGYQFFRYTSVEVKPNLPEAMLWEVERHPKAAHVIIVDSDAVFGYVDDGSIANGFRLFDKQVTFERMTAQDLIKTRRLARLQFALLFFAPSEARGDVFAPPGDREKLSSYLRSTFGEIRNSRTTDLEEGKTLVSYYVVPGSASYGKIGAD